MLRVRAAARSSTRADALAVISFLGWVVYTTASLYLLVLFVRMVIDWMQFLIPSFRPRGVVLVLANVVYALTDPPLRVLRRVIPPLRLGGGAALDVGFMVLFIAVIIIQRLGYVIQVLA